MRQAPIYIKPRRRGKIKQYYEQLDIDFINDISAVIVGTPTYYANMCWQFKKQFDEEWEYNLAGKIGAVYATANCIHGGADIAISSVINHLLVKGMLVYSSETGCGESLIYLGSVAIGGQIEERAELVSLFGKRVAEKTLEIFGDTI